MARPISLAWLTIADLSPPDAISLAAKLGYQSIGTRLLPALPGGGFAPLIEDPAQLRETQRRIADAGVGIYDVEIVRIGADFDVASLAPFLEVCAALGAKAVLVAGDDPVEARLTDSYAAFCRAAAPYGLTANLEFMPWTCVRNARAALRIVEKAAQPNGRVLVDALHFARSGSSLADIAAIAPKWLDYAQICDAPAAIPPTNEGLIFDARQNRLLPGEGAIPLVELFAFLPENLPASVEIPNFSRVAALGLEEWARKALKTSHRIFDLVEARRSNASSSQMC